MGRNCHKIADALQVVTCGKINNVSYMHQVPHLFSIFNLHVSFRLYDLDFSVLRFDNDNRKHKKKKKKKKHIRKLKGFLEYLDPRFQKKSREKKEESGPPGGSFCEQYRHQGSNQAHKEGKPSGAGDSKKYGSVTSSEYVTGKGPGRVRRTPFCSRRHCCLKQSLNACAMKSRLYIMASQQSALMFKKQKVDRLFCFPFLNDC